jgi:hypothetical protein
MKQYSYPVEFSPVYQTGVLMHAADAAAPLAVRRRQVSLLRRQHVEDSVCSRRMGRCPRSVAAENRGLSMEVSLLVVTRF